MVSLTFILLFSAYLIIYANGSIVSFIDPCKPEDQVCLLNSSNKALLHMLTGLPDLGVPSSDPLRIEKIQVLNGDLKLLFKDVIVVGHKQSKITNIERNVAENIIKLTAQSLFVSNGTYEVSGKLAGLPVEGSGHFLVKTDKIIIKIILKLKSVERDGQTYWNIIHTDIDFEPVEKIYIKFDNLFNGDKAKAEPIEKLFEQNWRQLITTVGRPIMQEVMQHEIDNINIFFKKVPLSELQKS